MGDETPPLTVPLGLLELDADGTVLYYKPEQAEGRRAPGGADIVGKNLFAEVMRAANLRDLRDRLGDFCRGHDPARSFEFTFNSERASLPARVLLARTREHYAGVDRESFFVQITKA